MLVRGVVVRHPRHLGVHGGPAELLLVGVLTGRHLHQRRAAEEDLGLVVDHDHVVAGAGQVGPAGGRRPEDQRDGGDGRGRQGGDVAEDLARGQVELQLVGQVGAARLDQEDHRQAVLPADGQGPQDLAHGDRVQRAGSHRRVVGQDHALGPRDLTDAGDNGPADRELRPVAGGDRQLQEGGVGVDQELDPLPGQEPTPLVVAIDVGLPTAGHGLIDQVLVVVEHRLHGLAVGSVGLAPGVEIRGQDGHRCRLQALGLGVDRRRAPVKVVGSRADCEVRVRLGAVGRRTQH